MIKTDKSKALVIGVGPERGLGGALCRRFAEEGHHVFVSGRTPEKLELVCNSIEKNGGCATPIACDATKEEQVVKLFREVKDSGFGQLDLAVYNVGNSTPGNIRDMEAAFFEKAWKILCFGGFLFGKECTKSMLPAGGTLIFTGASASLRGKSGFGAFNSGKAALRTLAQAMAKEYGPEGLHVGHVIIDGGIAGDKWFSRLGNEPDEEDVKKFIGLEALVDAYWMLYQQKAQGWSFEIDLRTAIENW